MKRIAVTGWALQFVGLALWAYGYFVPGHPPLIDWQAKLPAWAADWIPNLEAELGLGLMLVAMIPMYWPSQQSGRD